MNFHSMAVAGLRRVQTVVIAFASRKILTYGCDLHLGARTRIWTPDRVVIGDNVYKRMCISNAMQESETM